MESAVRASALDTQCWAEQPFRLKFVLSGVLLHSVSVPGVVFNQPFYRLTSNPDHPTPPFDALDARLHAARVLAHPIEIALPRLGFHAGAIRYVPAQYRRYHIDIAGSFADYLGKFHGKTRNTLRRKVRRFADLSGGVVDLREFRRPDQMREFQHLACEVSKKSYQGRLLDAGLNDSAAFLDSITELARRDAVRGYVLCHEHTPVSYMFCPGDAEVLTYKTTGYDPAYADRDVGTVLFYLVLERLFAERRFRRFDLGAGEYQYKELFSTGHTLVADIYYFRRTPANLLLLTAHSAVDGAMAMTRAVLGPTGLHRRLRKFVHERYR
jgi:CelD/BcsL family acetyltransferase involved in cellulose biosynthesis